MYAVVETGGKQYKVVPGQTIQVDKIESEDGSTVELDRVLLVADGDKIIQGKPLVPGAKVVASVLSQGKGDKILVFRYKSKVRSRRKTGHRQLYTKLAIKDIVLAS